MKRLMSFLFVAIVSAVLVGCASHSQDYLKKGSEINSLVVPQNVPVLKQQNYYPIPSVVQSGPVKPVSLLPPTLRDKGSV